MCEALWYRGIALGRSVLEWEFGRVTRRRRNRSIDSVFHEKSFKAVPLSSEKTLGWVPPATYDLQTFLPKINQQVYDFQISVVTKSASFERLSKEDKIVIKKNLRFYKRINKAVVDFIEKQSEKFEL